MQGVPMREWLYALVPVVLVVYFILDPAAFGTTLRWTMGVGY